MATRTLLSLAEFEQLPDEDVRQELDEGELITMPPAQDRHGTVQGNLHYFLKHFLRGKALGRVVVEVGCLLSREPPTVRAPDVAFLRAGRVAPQSGYQVGAPDLAIEVVSPSDTATQLDRKVDQYLKAGAHTVWVVHPDSHQVRIFESDGTTRLVGENDTLTLPELLPGFSLPVRDIFES